MSRYVLNWGEVVEFDAKNEFEIFEIIKGALRISAVDEEKSLKELGDCARRWMSKDVGFNTIRSAVKTFLEQNLLTNISSSSIAYNTQMTSDWCKSAFNCYLKTGLIPRSQFIAIQKVADEIRMISDSSDDATITRVLGFESNGFPFSSYHFAERFKYLSGRPVPALAMLYFIWEYLETKCEKSCDFSTCHTIFYTQFPEVFHKFANFWQFTLGLSMEKEFFKQSLNLFADFLTSNPNILHDSFAEHTPRARIPEHANMYFAYGSNMDMSQMKTRCPSAKFVGLSNIKNFEYFIDQRGVASLRPKFGSTAKGILWDISDREDWKSLDRYEGVHNDFYRRQHIIDADLTGEQECAVYISTTAAPGTPRSGYQEKIVNAVHDLKHQLIKEFDDMKAEEFVEAGGDWRGFDQAMENWANEMKDWLRA
jgi:hypothetical protein